MTTLPFADECVDSILIVTRLCFVSRPGAVLHEAARVLAQADGWWSGI